MATTLSPSGLDKPQTGDFGGTFFPDLEAAIQFLNDHTHTGQAGSGTQLGLSSVKGKYYNPTITWGAQDGTTGLYPGVISIASTGLALAYNTSDGVVPTFYISNEKILLKYVVNSTTQLTIYSFDNTIAPVIELGV